MCPGLPYIFSVYDRGCCPWSDLCRDFGERATKVKIVRRYRGPRSADCIDARLSRVPKGSRISRLASHLPEYLRDVQEDIRKQVNRRWQLFLIIVFQVSTRQSTYFDVKFPVTFAPIDTWCMSIHPYYYIIEHSLLVRSIYIQCVI